MSKQHWFKPSLRLKKSADGPNITIDIRADTSKPGGNSPPEAWPGDGAAARLGPGRDGALIGLLPHVSHRYTEGLKRLSHQWLTGGLQRGCAVER